MKLLTQNGKPTKALKIALGLHLVFLLCAGFLAMPDKEEPEEYLFEMVSTPPPLDTPQEETPQPIEEPPPPHEPEPEPEPEVLPEPEPLAPEPPAPPKPQPNPTPKPVIKKKDPPKPKPAPRPTPKKLKKTTPVKKTAPIKKVTPKPRPRPAPKPKTPPQIKVNNPTPSPIRPTHNAPVRPVAPPPVTQAQLDQYLGLYQRLFLRHWHRPPQGFLANKEVLLQFTISPSGHLQSFRLVRPSGDKQLDASILNALKSIRSRGEIIPPPGRQTRTFQLAFTPR